MKEPVSRLAILTQLILAIIAISFLASCAGPSPAKSESENLLEPEPVTTLIDTHAEQSPPDITIRLAFVGDILLARGCGQKIQRYGIEYPFAEVKSILSSADIAFGNLEGTLTGTRVTGSRTDWTFRSPPEFGQSLVDGGFDIVTLANNHINDAGVSGITDTVQALQNLGIRYVGAGENISEARSLRIIDFNGLKIGFLAYTDIANIGLNFASATETRPGVASAQTDFIFEEIATAERKVDLLVVSYHWGNEYQTSPSERQQFLAYNSIDSGADIVIGHHPHVLQRVEEYNGKTIAFSLGNFVFDSYRTVQTTSMILWIDWDSATGNQAYREIPCRITDFRPVPTQEWTRVQ
ncbi:MAG TPA: CapA family protein [bacterium]|jgi:poly-gamma-glutamate synthesis protein (capsule biosynthesis protein)